MGESYAVLTGDVIRSTRLNPTERDDLIRNLKASFQDVELMLIDSVRGHFQIFRGDSFQAAFQPPGIGVTAALLLHAAFRQRATAEGPTRASGLRIAIGTGSVDRLDKHHTSEATGEAFHNSGLTIDRMRGTQRLAIRTPLDTVNAELEVECRLLDSILADWSPEQAEALSMMLGGLTQEVVGRRIGISQPGVRQRLKRAGWDGIRLFLRRSETLLNRSTVPKNL
jgi:hypothetical protein